MKNHLLVPLTIFVSFWGPAAPARVLMMSTIRSPSHSLWYNKLAKLLVGRGHEVTLLDSVDRKEDVANLTRVYLEGAYVVPLTNLDDLSWTTSPIFGINLLYNASTASCRNELFSAGSRRFLESVERENKTFDLVIHDGVNCECFLGWVWRLGGRPSLVQATAYGRPQGMFLAAGDSWNPAYSLADMINFPAPMRFSQRLVNSLVYAYNRYVYAGYLAEQNAMAKEFFGAGVTPLEEISRNTSVFLVNSHIVLHGVRPQVPAVVSVGGFHIDKSDKKMEKDTEDFIKGAKDGVIYFSLGTNVLSSNMDAAKRDMFLDAFRDLPQRVLWKWEKDVIPNKPPNVMVSKWFPQNQILAHPNVKLYISHGGLLGSQEALHHGVPLVVLPFFIDQHSTAERLKNLGVAVSLEYSSLTKEAILKAIRTVLSEPSFSENMKSVSRRFVDQPDTPQDRALFWIEYALRHPDGSLMRSPTADMPFHQKILLDVLLLVVVVLLVAVFILVGCLKLCLRKMRSPSKTKQQ